MEIFKTHRSSSNVTLGLKAMMEMEVLGLLDMRNRMDEKLLDNTEHVFATIHFRMLISIS